MSIELPVLRLGLSGFSAEQQDQLSAALQQASPGNMVWQLGKFSDSDAWWVNGSRIQLLGDGTVRVASGIPAGRSVQLNLAEVDRPIAFSLPLASRQFDPLYTFEYDSLPSMHGVLEKFEGWLRPLVAQFCLASRIIEHETVLGAGVFHVSVNGALIAVVDMHGEVGVLPTVGPADFEHAMWSRRPSAAKEIPEQFVRSSLSQLMWQYAVRTTRDVLPKHYRSGPLYFRRPPRLPQRLMRDSHLLLLRELAGAPGTFEELSQRTGLVGDHLARDLAALYLVGSITSNAQRAASSRAGRNADARDSSHSRPPSIIPSVLDSRPPVGRKPPVFSDMTAPAPFRGR